MPSFKKEYAQIYDLLYQAKDYPYECARIEHFINTFRPDARTIMDYGCGTGNHAGMLAKKGYTLYCLDRNEHMLTVAKEKFARNDKMHFSTTDARDGIPPRSIDVVVVLFDVLSYMITNKELNDFFRYIQRTLAKGGLLIFDFWYGPGVIHLKPEKRWNEYDFGDKKILRLTSPEHDASNCIVNVSHEVLLFENDAVVERFIDIHGMRYFFKNEIQLLLEYHGFEILKFGTWGNIDEAPTENDWSALAVTSVGIAG